MTDPIANMISTIKNALRINSNQTLIPASNLKENVTKILKEEGFLKDYKKIVKKNHQYLQISLKYNQEMPAISEIQRVSRPGRRFYAGKKEIKKMSRGYGVLILSTPQGVMTDKKAQEKGVGGEIICRVW